MHRPIPIGCHKADQMAILLGFKSKKAFHKKLREMGWLIFDKNGLKHGSANLPRKIVIDMGYADKLQCSRINPADPNKPLPYEVPYFTPKGLEVLKKILLEGEPMQKFFPKVTTTCNADQEDKKKEFDRKAAEIAAEKTLSNFKEMGIF